MLQVARLAPRQLEEAADVVATFLETQWHEEGGAMDRSGKSDLYYTPFLLECGVALQREAAIDRVRPYLRSFEDGRGLDMVHTASLVRSYAALGEGIPEDVAAAACATFNERRAADGGFASEPGEESGALYSAFLALGVYQDVGQPMPEPERLATSIERLRCRDGGYADSFQLSMGTTPTTAAATALLRHLDQPVPPDVGPWLLAQIHASGGFLAMPEAPLPDLLSTATALHALSVSGTSFTPVRESCLDFLDSLWTGKGFVSTWDDDELDCEYAFYALLALGHLSL